jgi:hypothetical protein
MMMHDKTGIEARSSSSSSLLPLSDVALLWSCSAARSGACLGMHERGSDGLLDHPSASLTHGAAEGVLAA